MYRTCFWEDPACIMTLDSHFIRGMINEIFVVSVHTHFSVLELHKCVNLPTEEQCSRDIQLFPHGMQK